MVTHAFNAMPGLHHREPGLLGSGLTQSHVQCGFIADGQHVHPAMLKVLLRAGEYSRGLFLVSDALAPLGLPDGKYPWDTREIEVINGTASLMDNDNGPACLSTGIHDVKKEVIRVFPSIAHDFLSVETDNNYLSEIIIYNIYSQEIFRKTFSGSSTIQMDRFPNGIYFYVVSNGYFELTKGKVVKE